MITKCSRFGVHITSHCRRICSLAFAQRLYRQVRGACDEMVRTTLYEAAQILLVRDKMVLAQSLGDADRQAARHEKGDRRPGTSPGRDHASHLGRRHRVPLDPERRSGMKTVTDERRKLELHRVVE